MTIVSQFTYCGIVTPYVDWVKLTKVMAFCLMAWSHYWTSAVFLFLRLCGIYLEALSLRSPSLKITLLKLLSNRAGANELKYMLINKNDCLAAQNPTPSSNVKITLTLTHLDSIRYVIA